MCGIFAYIGHEALSITDVLGVLHLLEKDQEPDEKTPVGGDGAGITYLNHTGKLTLTKVGKTLNISPVGDLRLQLGKNTPESQIVLAHVRRASPEFEKTTVLKESAQPYQPQCTRSLNFALAHNGKVANYEQVKNQLGPTHKFELPKQEATDSETIAHRFEELLKKTKDSANAAHALFTRIEGTDKQGNTVAILSTRKTQVHLGVIQKGKTRGLIAYANPRNEILICSRATPVRKILSEFLTRNQFEKTIAIHRHDAVNLEVYFTRKVI